jgi:type VI protein secretion system component VasK
MEELEGLRKELILLESVNESNLMFYIKVVGRFVLRIVAAVLFILVTIGLAKSVGPLAIVVAAIGAVTASFGVYGIIMTASEEILSKIAKEKDINNLSKDKKNELEKKVNVISKELIKIKKQF